MSNNIINGRTISNDAFLALEEIFQAYAAACGDAVKCEPHITNELYIAGLVVGKRCAGGALIPSDRALDLLDLVESNGIRNGEPRNAYDARLELTRR
jgi:hypothetical protein